MEHYIYLEDLIKEVNTYADKRGLSLRLPNYDEQTYFPFLEAYVERDTPLENKKLILLNMRLLQFLYPTRVNNKLIPLCATSSLIYSEEENDNKILMYTTLELDEDVDDAIYTGVLTPSQRRDIKQEVKELNKVLELIIKRNLKESTNPASLIYPDKQFNVCNIKEKVNDTDESKDNDDIAKPTLFKKDANMIIQEWDTTTIETKNHNTLVGEYIYDFKQKKAYTLKEDNL